MNDELNVPEEKVVEEAIRALREAPIPAGPPPEAIQVVLAAGRPGDAGAERIRVIRRFTMNRIAKIAAAILIVAGIAGLVIFLTVGHGGARVAWADVQAQILAAQTVTFKAVMHQPGAPDIKVAVMIMEPGKLRQELTIGGEEVTQILRLREGKMLLLSHKEKVAVYFDLSGLPEKVRQAHEEGDLLTRLKKLIEESETELGEKEIDGRLAKGYRGEKDGQAFTVWVDAYTGEPIEMEAKMYQGGVQLTLSDIEFGKELDESLFSMDVPDGYKQHGEEPFEIGKATVEDMVGFFRFWVEARGGTFPDTLSEVEHIRDITPAFGKIGKEFGDEEVLKRSIPMARARLYLQMHPKTQNQYAGKGVKLGDADTAVFWYKPEGSETYKVIYGDLRVEDVAEEDLPAQPAARTAEDEVQPSAPTTQMNSGMLLGERTPKQAAKEIVDRCWKAILEDDWEEVARLWLGFGPNQRLPEKWSGVRSVQVGQPVNRGLFGCDGWLALVTPITLEYESGKTEEWDMLVVFVGSGDDERCSLQGLGTFGRR